MKYLIDDIKKTIVFESTEVLSISVVNVFLNQLSTMYLDIFEWEIGVVGKLSDEKEAILSKKEVPEKPQEPDFDFTQNKLPKEEKE